MTTELRDGVWRLACRGVNAYLAAPDDAAGPTLVDAGTPWDAGAIRTGVARAGFDLGDIERVLLTHYDVDHVGALADLARDGLDAPVVAADPDAGHLAGGTRPPLSNHKGLFQRALAPLVERPDLRVERVDDGEAVGSFDVYRTPGHTPGHVAYVHDGLATGFVGDLVFEREGRLRASPWLLSYDADAVLESIESLADRAPAFEALCMGHGTPVRAEGSVVLARLGAAAARRL
jgi:glyoxylase-like metal-dependent hydrolase (beta-lactamase superfamily II)